MEAEVEGTAVRPAEALGTTPETVKPPDVVLLRVVVMGASALATVETAVGVLADTLTRVTVLAGDAAVVVRVAPRPEGGVVGLAALRGVGAAVQPLLDGR